jgi:protein arginine kinase
MVDELFIITQPAHLQKKFAEKLGADERDLLRADMLRERLRGVSRPLSAPPGLETGAKLDKPSEQ